MSSTDIVDASLCLSVINNKENYRYIYKKYERKIKNYISSRINKESRTYKEDIQDLTLIVMERLYNRVIGGGVRSLIGEVYLICKNEIIRYYQKRLFVEECIPADEWISYVTPEQITINNEFKDNIFIFIKKLPGVQSRIAEMFFIEDLTHEEIISDLSISKFRLNCELREIRTRIAKSIRPERRLESLKKKYIYSPAEEAYVKNNFGKFPMKELFNDFERTFHSGISYKSFRRYCNETLGLKLDDRYKFCKSKILVSNEEDRFIVSNYKYMTVFNIIKELNKRRSDTDQIPYNRFLETYISKKLKLTKK